MPPVNHPQLANEPTPSWDIALLFPTQGQWCEYEYLQLNTRRLVELRNGNVEVLPLPSIAHQRIVSFLYRLLFAFTAPRLLGEVLFAPVRVRLSSELYREPDIVFLLAANARNIGKQSVEHPDLVIEVVSPDDPDRDLVIKRTEYAAAGIPEYWIVDPRTRAVTVLKLVDGAYNVHAEAAAGQHLVGSALLPGFEVDPALVFAAAEPA